MQQPVKPRQEYVRKDKVVEVLPVVNTSEPRSIVDVELENEINVDLIQGKTLPAQNEMLPVAEREGIHAAVFGDDINSTDGSEFVEATQQNFEEESTNNTNDSQLVPVVQKDMDFLKKS